MVEEDPSTAGQDGDKRRVLYGRRSAGKLRPYRKALIEELLPTISVTLPSAGNLHPVDLFETAMEEYWLEIGFGGGEHLAETAAMHPKVGFVGVEPFVSGVGRMLSEIDRRSLGNVRLLVDDARLLLRVLAHSSLDRVVILFPDPWPKLRHQKRRIVNDETLGLIASALKPGGLLRMASDHVDYSRWMLAHALRQPGLEWQAERSADWLVRPDDQPMTRYEQKGLEAGRPSAFLTFRKI